MAEQTFKKVLVYVGAAKMDPQLPGLAIDYGVEAQDNSVVGNDTRTQKAGLRNASVALTGFWDSKPEANTFGLVGEDDIPFLASEPNGAEDAVGFMGYGLAAETEFGGAVGELIRGNLTVQTSRLARGVVALDLVTGDGSGFSTGQQLGILDAHDQMLVPLHVHEGAGGTLDFVVQSDNNAGFTSPTVRATSQTFTGPGYEMLVVNGPIANDDYWRVQWTVAGGGSYGFAAGMGRYNF